MGSDSASASPVRVKLGRPADDAIPPSGAAPVDPLPPPGGVDTRARQHRRLDLLLILALIVVAAIPRLVLQAQAPTFAFADSTGYLEPAYDLATGQGFTPRLKRPVAYPLLIAGTFAAAGLDLRALTVLQHLLGIVTVVLTYLLGRVCFNRAVGFCAALLVAVSGPQLTYEHAPLTEAPFTALLVGTCLALAALMRTPAIWPAVVAGLLLGLMTLLKPVAQALLPLALVLALLRPGARLPRLTTVAVLSVTFALVVLPWMARNLAFHGRLSVGGSLGESLLARTLQYSRGEFVFDSPDLSPDPNPQRAAARSIVQAATGTDATSGAVRFEVTQQIGLSEAEADELFRQITLEAILRQPLTYGRAVLTSLVAIFRVPERSLATLWTSQRAWEVHPTLHQLVRLPTVWQEAYRERPEATLQVFRPSRYGLLFPLLAILGVIAAWRLRPLAPAVAVAAVGGLLLFLHVALDGPVARYRYLVEPLTNVLMLGAIATTLAWARRPLAAAAASDVTTPRLRATGRLSMVVLVLTALVVAPRLLHLDRFDPSAFGNQYDEGIRLEQLALMSAGFRPFFEIYASQGPLLLAYFHPFFEALGRTVPAGRAPTVLASLVCLAGVYLVALRLGGAASALAALAFLGLSPQFLGVSRVALAEVPSIAPALLALFLAAVYRERRRPAALFASGVSFALAILLKPMVAPAIVPIALLLLPRCWDRGLSWRQRLWPGDLLVWSATACAVCLTVILLAGPMVLYEQFVAYRQNAVGLGARGHEYWSLDTNWDQIRLELRADLPLILLALAAILPASFGSPRFAALSVSAVVAVLALLLLYSPLAEKHVAYLIPPLALLGAAGVAGAIRLLRPPGTVWRAAATLPLAVTLAAYLLSLDQTLRDDWRLTAPNTLTMAPERDLADAISSVTRSTDDGQYFVSDHPYLAFVADRLVPPRLVDMSRTRIVSGSLTTQEAIEQTEALQAQAVAVWAGRIPMLRTYAAWLDEGFTLVRMYDRNRAVYLRNDLAQSAGAVLLGPDDRPRFGDALEVAGFEVETLGAGRDMRLTITWRALRAIPADAYVLNFELLAANGSRALSRDDRLLPPWRTAPWAPGSQVVHRRWMDLDGVAAGEYELVCFVAAGRRGERLWATPPPSGRYPVNRGTGSVTLARLSVK